MYTFINFEFDGHRYRAKGTRDYVVAVKDLESNEIVVDGHERWLNEEMNLGILFAAAKALREEPRNDNLQA